MVYSLPKLPYASDALEPYYDKATVELHHDKHHAGYVNGLNNAIVKLEEARKANDFSLIKHWERELAFHGAGHILHTIFWENMRPGKEDNKPEGAMLEAIEKNFGSFDAFSSQFKAATIAIEGSGWGALVQVSDGSLQIVAVENHQKMMLPESTILVLCDVWEHAYYLKYQNRRAEWVDNFMYLINWDEVSKRLSC
jgi:superoxide dismutase, Fe-Mn family